MWESMREAEQTFIGITSLNKHYAIDATRKSLWEYLLLCEQLKMEVKQLEKK